MKKSTNLKMVLLVFLTTLIGCSNNDDLDNNLNEEFLTARIDGAEWNVKKEEGIISCKKIMTSRGVVNLLIKAIDANGNEIELYVDNYIGNRTYVFGDNILNTNRMNFKQKDNGHSWGVITNLSRDISLNKLEVLNDDGLYLKGSFNFEGVNMLDMSSKSFQDGHFSFRLKSENQ